MSDIQSENKDLLDAARQFSEAELIDLVDNDTKDPTLPGGVAVMSVPAGRALQSVKKYLDEYRTRPERKTGTSNLTTIDSFIAQVNRSKDDDSVIFADVANRLAPRLIAVLDYNKAGAKGEPRFGTHRAHYLYPVSDQWKAWTTARDNMSQVDFAEFLEARIMDVLDATSLDPEAKGQLAAFCRQLGIKLATPQGLMELSRGLTVHAEHKVHQAVNVGTGEGQISFTENHTDATGAAVKIPGGFAIAIPVFLGGAAYQIPVRLRYRVKDGQVRWALQPQRTTEVFDDAVNESVANVTTKTGLVTLYGTPES